MATSINMITTPKHPPPSPLPTPLLILPTVTPIPTIIEPITAKDNKGIPPALVFIKLFYYTTNIEVVIFSFYLRFEKTTRLICAK